MKTLLMHTSFLFALPSFLSGVARTLDLGGEFDDYNTAETDETEDDKQGPPQCSSRIDK